MLSRFDERVSYLTSIFDTFQSLSIFARLMYFNLDFRLCFSIVLWPLITIGIGGMKSWVSSSMMRLGRTHCERSLYLKSHTALTVNIIGIMRLLSLNHFLRGQHLLIGASCQHKPHHMESITLPPFKGH